ncbi:FAD-dependent oxidoreductase [Brevibacillus composti]|uniref:FAD-dependent oxidoreductase n=1 Tax=Brevibacillus composti TaxID=2796470 RepID=A0A7T5JN33_9BACL|nr:FAD-dependent oxidoreductase [Brevibacillus composti]QQE73652.1 FAD-dependent oxidoreductase [Brevibacillus composti]QUO40734.1 FAD-dependent oxidoreductase [Brevibacillus composti]
MYDIAIIGAGPAGASAALFAAKAGKSTLLVDSDKGMTKRAWVENHYGVKGISGPEMIEIGKQQAAHFGAKLIADQVTEITKTADGFSLATEENGSFEAKHVILATGLSVDVAEKAGVATKPGTEPRIKTVVDADASGKTNIPGIWAAGTCAGVSVHTIITAGDGAKVAINIISELNGERYVDHDILKKEG